MNDIDVRDVLQQATRHLSADPDLLDGVRRGGQRRLVRRRAVLGGSLAAVLGGVAGGATLWGRDRMPTPTGSPLLDRPTAGDLAGDAGYLRRVRAAWWDTYGDAANQAAFIGEPHVVWAGATPVGPAAFVAQRDISGGDALSMTVSFVEPTPGGPALVEPQGYVPADPDSLFSRVVLLGARRDVLVVLDTGVAVRWSPRLRYAADGRILRDFRPVRFADGAAVLSVPAQGPQISIALLTDPPRSEPTEEIANALRIAGQDSGGSVQYRALPDLAKLWPDDPAKADAEVQPWAAPALLPYLDRGGYHPKVGSAWLIRGSTLDRRRFCVQTHSAYDSRIRILTVIGRPGRTPKVSYSGELDPGSVLPIVVRLPDRQGVVVAGEYVSLRYRAARGEWLKVKGDAALLPDSAIEAEVRREGQPPVVVALD